MNELKKFGVLAIPVIADFIESKKNDESALLLVEGLESYAGTFGLDESEKSILVYVLKE